MKLEHIIEALENANSQVMKDKKLVIKALKHDGSLLQYVDESLKKDKEVVRSAVKEYSDSLAFADSSLLSDAKFMLEMIKLSKDSLFFASESLKKDKNFIIEAIKTNVHSIRHISKSLKKDASVMLEAVKYDMYVAMCYSDVSLFKDRKFMLNAIAINSDTLSFVHDSLFDKQFLIDAMKATKSFRLGDIFNKKDMLFNVLFIFTVNSLISDNKRAQKKHIKLIQSAINEYIKQYVDFSQTITKIPLPLEIKSNIVSYMQRSSFFKNTDSKNAVYKHLDLAEKSAKKIYSARNTL